MKILSLPLVVLALIFGLALAGPLRDKWELDNQHTQALQLIDEQRQQFDFQQYQAQQQATLPAKIAGQYGLLILLVVGAGGIFWTLYDGYNQRRTPLVRFDPNNPLMPRWMLEQGNQELIQAMVRALELSGQAQIAKAQFQPGQQPYHYAPHIAISQPRAIEAPSMLNQGVGDTPAALPAPTDLATLVRSFQPAADRILLALGEGGELLTVPATQLCHVALCGATGQGKSNLLRLLLPQLQAIGARVVLTDPHYTDVDPENGDDWRAIRERLYLPPAVNARDIDGMLEYVLGELERRLVLRNKGERVGAPLFLAYDELPVIVDTVKNAPERLGRILREGRKVGILTVGASQEFLVKTIGGSSGAREQYRTAYYVGGDRASAAALLDLPARTIDDGPLGHGIALLRSKATPTAQLVRVPLADNTGISMLLATSEGTSIPTSKYPITTRVGSGSEVGMEVGMEVVTSTHQEASNLRIEQIRQLLREKRTQNEIISQVWHVSAGRAYRAAADELREILAILVAN